MPHMPAHVATIQIQTGPYVLCPGVSHPDPRICWGIPTSRGPESRRLARRASPGTTGPNERRTARGRPVGLEGRDHEPVDTWDWSV